MSLPSDPKKRKQMPIARGVLDYFPDAMAAVAEVSRLGNEQHNPGQPMHWARGKSTDHADCIVRHLIERGTVDIDGARHSAKLAWRALALLQTEIEAQDLAKTDARVAFPEMSDIILKQEPEVLGTVLISPETPRTDIIRWDRPVEEPGDDIGNLKHPDEIAKANDGRITASEIHARRALRGPGGI